MSVLRFWLVLIVCVACSPSRDVPRRATVRDDYGDVIPFTVHPKRIVSLDPATTEMLFAVGAGPRLVGRSKWDHWPDSARMVPDLGNALRPNVEAVLAARPDLVFLYASADNRPAAERFHAAGIPTIALKIDRIAVADRALRVIGRVTGDSARGDAVADSVQATLNAVRAATASLPRPIVVWAMAYRPVMVIGGGSFLSELIDIAGARNAYAEIAQPSPIVTLEDIVHRDPAYVIVGGGVTPTSHVDAAWYAIPAVRAGRVLLTNTDSIARPSVNLGHAAVMLARLIHPDVRLP